jgi:hypothetical protein
MLISKQLEEIENELYNINRQISIQIGFQRQDLDLMEINKKIGECIKKLRTLREEEFDN